MVRSQTLGRRKTTRNGEVLQSPKQGQGKARQNYTKLIYIYICIIINIYIYMCIYIYVYQFCIICAVPQRHQGWD